jgi:hypothetical protein
MLSYEDIIPSVKKMNPNSKFFSFDRLAKFAKIVVYYFTVSSLFGCQLLDSAPTSTTPLVEVQILTPSLLTETPVPACVLLSSVELSVSIVSENSVGIKIVGLIPSEAVHAIFSSQIKGQEKEIVISGTANEKGVFADSVGLRSQEVDSEFKDWQIRVVHSRGSTCTEISLPEK